MRAQIKAILKHLKETKNLRICSTYIQPHILKTYADAIIIVIEILNTSQAMLANSPNLLPIILQNIQVYLWFIQICIQSRFPHYAHNFEYNTKKILILYISTKNVITKNKKASKTKITQK